MQLSDSFRTNAALAVLVGVWTLGWFLTEVGLESSTPFSFTAVRFLLAAVLMQSILAWRQKRGALKSMEWVWVALIGLFQTTLMFSLATYGLLEVGIARAAILIYSTPLWSSLLGWLFLKERFTPLKCAGLMAGCVGMVVMVSPSLSKESFIGEALLVGSAMSWSISSFLLKKYLPNTDKLTIGTWQMTFGAIGLLVLMLMVDGGVKFNVNAESLLAMLYVSVIGSVVAFSLWFYVVPRIDLLHSSMASVAVPVAVLGIEGVALEQHLDTTLLSASMLIIGGIVLVFLSDHMGRNKR
ncbi:MULTISPECIES: DMT family transporter [unclassified Pseudomonas]|uniref:DMT family transporter n=1 Tax=unclassified Pseudomonas TaxID=196821 RepID=UPI00216031AE|nr:EamA family transporter [Pseudomonas sp. B21-015]UVM49746.1 EamA family transporter [Pseudomonas sp. B21-015]